MCENIRHGPLRGRCPKKVWINRPMDQRTNTILESHVHEIEHCAGTILKSTKSLESSIEVFKDSRQTKQIRWLLTLAFCIDQSLNHETGKAA